MQQEMYLKEIAKRARKVDKALASGIEIAQRYDLVPRQEPLEFKVFVDERSIPVKIGESESSVAFKRRGRWITVLEKK